MTKKTATKKSAAKKSVTRTAWKILINPNSKAASNSYLSSKNYVNFLEAGRQCVSDLNTESLHGVVDSLAQKLSLSAKDTEIVYAFLEKGPSKVPFTRFLACDNEKLRSNCLWVIGDEKYRKDYLSHLDEIAKALHDPCSDVRWSALNNLIYLASCGKKAKIDKIIRSCLTSDDEEFAMSVAKTLPDLCTKDAYPELIYEFLDSNKVFDLRVALEMLEYCMGQITYSDKKPWLKANFARRLLDLLSHSDTVVRTKVAWFAEEMLDSPEEKEAFACELLDSKEVAGIVAGLGIWKCDEDSPKSLAYFDKVLSLMLHEDATVREQAAEKTVRHFWKDTCNKRIESFYHTHANELPIEAWVKLNIPSDSQEIFKIYAPRIRSFLPEATPRDEYSLCLLLDGLGCLNDEELALCANSEYGDARAWVLERTYYAQGAKGIDIYKAAVDDPYERVRERALEYVLKFEPQQPDSATDSKEIKAICSKWKKAGLVETGDLRTYLKATSIKDLSGDIVKQAQPSIRLIPQKKRSTDLKVGTSKLGGSPDLPIGVDWPLNDQSSPARPLSFVAQLNLADLPQEGAKLGLPASGILCFFVDPEDYAEGWCASIFAVLYASADTTVERCSPPKGVQTYSPRLFMPRCELSLPDWDNLAAAIALETDSPYRVVYNRLLSDLGQDRDAKAHRMFGHPSYIQSDKLSDKEKLLLQLESDDECPWGDDGHLLYSISPRSLKKLDFGAASMMFECY